MNGDVEALVQDTLVAFVESVTDRTSPEAYAVVKAFMSLNPTCAALLGALGDTESANAVTSGGEPLRITKSWEHSE